MDGIRHPLKPLKPSRSLLASARFKTPGTFGALTNQAKKHKIHKSFISSYSPILLGIERWTKTQKLLAFTLKIYTY